jgi:hypothetical protein
MKHHPYQELIESSLENYWGGTRQLVEEYFSRPTPLEQNVYWLKVTLYKEIKSVTKILPKLAELYPKIDRGFDRYAYEGLAYELADEVKHYRLLADIYEWLTGEKIAADQCAPSPGQTQLEKLRKDIQEDLDLVPHLNVSHEMVFDSVMSRISGGDLQERLARAYGEIYGDEIHHYQLGWDELKAQELDQAQLDKLIAANRKVARQYLVMRNELFGHVLSDEQLKDIDAGKVRPYRPSGDR